MTDTADFGTPEQVATGIEHVWVNGVEVYAEGRLSGARAGRVLRRAGMTGADGDA